MIFSNWSWSRCTLLARSVLRSWSLLVKQVSSSSSQAFLLYIITIRNSLCMESQGRALVLHCFLGGLILKVNRCFTSYAKNSLFLGSEA